VPSAFAAPCEQLLPCEAAACGQAVFAAAPPLAEVEVLAPPIAVLLAQQALPVAPALADVAVVLPPIAVLLAQQAWPAALDGQALLTAVVVTALSLLAAAVWADTWLEIIKPPIIRPQIIKILDIIFIFLLFRLSDVYNNSLAEAKLDKFYASYKMTTSTHKKS
jgi:hypothetical protein